MEEVSAVTAVCLVAVLEKKQTALTFYCNVKHLTLN